MAKHWDLAYGMGIVTYPNRVVTFLGEPIRQRLRTFRDAGVEWAMAGGINLFDPFCEPVDEIVATAARWLREAGVRLTSFHCAGANYAYMDRDQAPLRANLVRTVETFAPLGFQTFVIHAGWIKFEPEDFQRLPDSALQHGECDRILVIYAF